MLRIEDLCVGYGSLDVIRGLSFEVGQGEIIALLGSNGAGKTTALRTIAGLHRAASGRIVFDEADITEWGAARIAGCGLRLVPEGRQLFPDHTVMENLELGAYRRLRAGGKQAVRKDIGEFLDLFPAIGTLMGQKAGLLSGGEQQMVAIGRAFIGRPELLMLDEPSLGLAPILVKSLFEALRKLRDGGMTLLLVEQMAQMALDICDRAYVLEAGSIRLSGNRNELLDHPHVLEAYLGKAAG
ncbi:MAG: ABC transporter ATP-binding protein [Rhodospirillaceae bacterium]|nr:ABC transporter ATP-binding protein [Rhodospirillaceae bacterium]